MSMSKTLIEITKKDWRELGFYYEQDEVEKYWSFIGSVDGLLQFVSILDKYCSNARNHQVSEHNHLGPYMYLKIATMDACAINKDGIYGTIEDLKRLSGIIKRLLTNASPNGKILIDKEYSDLNEFHIVLEVRDDGFDPATADKQLWS